MWISKKKWNDIQKRTADLEVQVQNQQMLIEITYEFCRSVANKNKGGEENG